MRVKALLLVLGSLGCVAPRPGSLEWTAKAYGHAMLQGDQEGMNNHAASGVYFTSWGRDPQIGALHVIRTCPLSAEAGEERRVAVLFGGDLGNPVGALDLSMVNEGGVWRVKDAQMARTASGRPLYYLRNCDISFGANPIYYSVGAPQRQFINRGAAIPAPGPGGRSLLASPGTSVALP